MVFLDALKDLEPRWSGPWHEHELNQLPDSPGLYCVCECAPDGSSGDWRVNRPLFIGESSNVRRAVLDSDRWVDWRELVSESHSVCFGFQSAPPAKLELMQNAMIAYYRPPGNDPAAWV